MDQLMLNFKDMKLQLEKISEQLDRLQDKMRNNAEVIKVIHSFANEYINWKFFSNFQWSNPCVALKGHIIMFYFTYSVVIFEIDQLLGIQIDSVKWMETRFGLYYIKKSVDNVS